MLTYVISKMKTNIKNCFFAAAFTLISTGAIAQVSQGTVVVSGLIGASTNDVVLETTHGNYSREESKGFSLSLRPTLGYMLHDNLELGIGLSYSHSRSKDKDFLRAEGTNNYTDRSFGLSLDPYLKNM
ncbi:hypothetical protein GCM10028895_16230 [Pontibacter rugosus]